MANTLKSIVPKFWRRGESTRWQIHFHHAKILFKLDRPIETKFDVERWSLSKNFARNLI